LFVPAKITGTSRPVAPHGLEQVQRAARVDVEILARPREARRHRRLRGEVEDRGGVGHASASPPPAAGRRARNAPVPVPLHEPGEVVLHARAAQVVDDEHLLAARKKRVGEVRADEARAARVTAAGRTLRATPARRAA
jgi:hypothetical protein